MGSYVFTNKAVDDLSAIWDDTFETWSETQADKYYHMLLDYCQDLANNKASGKQYPEIREDILGIRAGVHIIFFRRLKNDKIEITRILHNRMDLKNRLKE